MFASYQLLGIDDEVDVCELCGKRDLKATMVLSALDANGNEVAVVRYGRDCGAKVLGVSVDRAEQLARGTARFTDDQLYHLICTALGNRPHAGSDAGPAGPNRAVGTVQGVWVEVEVARSERAKTLLAEGWNRALTVLFYTVVWRFASRVRGRPWASPTSSPR